LQTKITNPRIFKIIQSSLGMDCYLYIKSKRCRIYVLKTEFLLNPRVFLLLTFIRSTRENTDTVSLRSQETVFPRINNIPYDIDYCNYCWCLNSCRIWCRNRTVYLRPVAIGITTFQWSMVSPSVSVCNCKEYAEIRDVISQKTLSYSIIM